MARKDLKVTELDFEQIKTNFRNFLKTQTEYSDYNFDSSGFDTLLDVFAYNTHYNAFYINSAINESFLSTAQQRKNLAKAARSLNYIPKSRSAASINVNLSVVIPQTTLVAIFGSTSYGNVQLNRRNRFTTTIDNSSYTFMNLTAINLTQGDTTTSGGLTYENFTATDVTLRQGEFTSFTYTIDASDTNQRFIVPSDNVDTSILTVSGVKSGETASTIYSFYKDVDLQNITGTTYVYFLFENSDGEYEIRFGDGVYGRAPDDNEAIAIEFLNSDGNSANGANTFTAAANILVSGSTISDATVVVTTSARSAGGSVRESDTSIRNNAPLTYQSQDRAVVVNDYSSLIQSQFTNIETSVIWGGEDNDPPKYGRVFIASKPFGSDYLTESEKDNIKTFIKTKMVGSLRPEMVNPQYVNIVPTINVKFDSKKTTLNSSDIRDIAVAATKNFSTTNLEKFSTTYYNSQLIDTINDLDTSIQSISISLKLRKEFVPTIGAASSYILSYKNALLYPHTGHLGTVSTSTFTYNTYTGSSIILNSTGGLSIITTIDGVEITVVESAGTIDNTNGIITLTEFAPTAFTGNLLRVDVVPSTNDISSSREYITRIQEKDISMVITDVTTSTSLVSSSSTSTGGSTVTY